MSNKIKAFCEAARITAKQFSGADKVGGSLYLDGLTSIPAGFNPTVGGNLNLRGLTSIPAGFNPTVGGYLYLDGLTSIPAGFNPTVGGCLYLNGLISIPAGFNPTVGGYLGLSGLISIPAGFNPTVGGGLDLDGLTSIPAGFNPTVGGSLYLSGLISIPAGFNPTVGGYLDLRGLTSIPADFNPTVGGGLYLSGLTSIPAGFNPMVGGNLDLSGLTAETHQPEYPLKWNSGKYILSDGVLTEVLQKRGPVYRVRIVGKTETSYLVTNGKQWSHGKTLAAAKADLVYKISDRNPEKFKGLKLTSKLTFAEAVECYRVITGACGQGVKRFAEQAGLTKRKTFTIKEIITKTKGHWGAETFSAFFATKGEA